MSKKHKSSDVRELSIKYYLNNEDVTQKDVSEIFEISTRTFIRC